MNRDAGRTERSRPQPLHVPRASFDQQPKSNPRLAAHAPAVRRFLVLFIVAIWPALASGGALWFADLGPYVRGGHLAVVTVQDALTTRPGALAGREEGAPAAAGEPASGGGLAAGAGGSVSGARSIAYSLLAYLAGLLAPGFLALAVIQAGVLAGLVSILAARQGGPLWLWSLAVLLGSAPLMASTASPDVWAGLTLLGVLILFRHGASMAWSERGFALAALAFGIAAHASHILLAIALAGGCLLAAGRSTRVQALLLLGGVGVGVAGVLAVSFIGFGEASLAPKRCPIVLARAIEDGPALWHLEEHCDEYRYTVCEVFPDGFPTDAGNFLWGEGGVRERATPAQMDAIRAEEGLILRRSLAEYPFHQARRAAANFAAQAVLVFDHSSLGRTAHYLGDGAAWPGGEPRRRATRVTVLLQALGLVGLPLVAGAGVILRIVPFGSAERRLVALAVLGLLANAAICGALSVPVWRYQARIVWVVPLVGAALLVRSRPFGAARSAERDLSVATLHHQAVVRDEERDPLPAAHGA